MSAEFDVVRAGYDRIGTRYRDWTDDGTVRLRWADRLLADLPAASLVLDLGCGPGTIATGLLARGHRVVGVDGSLAQLRLARRAAPGAAFVQADMTRLALRPQALDAITCFYALGHVPSAAHRELFTAMASWLRPGGVLVANAPVGTGDELADEWLGVPMFFGGIGVAATRAAVLDAGLVLDTSEVVAEDEGDGRTVSFHWLAARRPALSERR